MAGGLFVRNGVAAPVWQSDARREVLSGGRNICNAGALKYSLLRKVRVVNLDGS
jgi:hypothetical protein